MLLSPTCSLVAGQVLAKSRQPTSLVAPSRGARFNSSTARTPNRGQQPWRLMAQAPATPDAPNPVRQALSGVASTIYKLSAARQQVDPRLPPLWQGLLKLDLKAVQAALAADPASANAPNPIAGSLDTPLLFISREGHYKYPPAEIPAALMRANADLERKDANGNTALEVALLSGWQNIAILLLDSGADTSGVAAIKDRVTCPDCKRVIAQRNL